MKFSPYSAPKRFVFKDPDTGYSYYAPTRKALIHHIVSYRQQNNLPQLDSLNLVVENYLCSLPENQGACVTTTLQRGLMTYLRGGIKLIKNYFYKKFVSEEVAERRALQCSTCPFNRSPDANGFDAWADSIAEKSVGSKKTSLHDKLFSCECCTCVLKAKVWYHPDNGKLTFDKEQTKQMKSVNCWQLKDLT